MNNFQRDFLFLNGAKARFFLTGLTILILLTFFSYASAAITPNHPRLILSSSKLSELRAKACYDASGNVISNCAPQASWTVLKNWADSNLNTTNSRSLAEYGPRHFALVYQITQNTQYADKAISLLEWFYNANIFNVQCSATQPNCGYYAGGASDPWHYSMRYLGVSVGLAYDWVYDRLTADQRTRFYTKMNGWIDVVLNSSTNGSNIWPGVNTGDNNFYYGHTAGIGVMAYATYEASGGNPNAQNYINLMTTRITDVITNYLEGNTYTCPNYRVTSAGCVEKGTGLGKGGDWAEGWNYGEDSMRPFINLLKAIKTAEGINYLNSLNFFKETPIFYLSATKPNLANIYAESDWTREATGAISAYSRNFMSMLADEFQGTQLSRQIQYWINNNAMPSYQLTSWDDYIAAEEFLWYNSAFPQENYNTLPLINYASGTQALMGRSGWASSDTWFTFRSGGRWTSHGHNGQGHFNIYKYADLAVNPNSLNSSGCSSLCAESTANNAVVNNSNSSGSYPAPDNNYNAYWRADANIKNYEDANSYTYIVGDSTDIYQTEDAQLESLVPYDSGVSFNQRAFVYIKDLDQFVIYDLYNVKSAAVSAQKIWLMYSVNTPTITGDTARIDNGQGRLFVKTLLPLNPSITTSSSGGLRPSGKATVPRLEVSPTAQQTNNQFLHVLYPTSTSTSSMTDTVRIDASTGNMVGAHIQSSLENNIVMFSSSATGATVSGSVSYTFNPTTTNTRHYLFGMQPNTLYYVSANSSASSTTVNVSAASGTTQAVSSLQGTLTFALNGLTVVPPSPSDTTSPSVPTGLSAQPVGSSQINLSWTASTDNVGVAGYRIYRCQGTGCTPSTQIATSATNSYQNIGLTANTTYVYRVSVYDAAGNVSAQSSSAIATTQSTADTTPPAAPTGLAVI